MVDIVSCNEVGFWRKITIFANKFLGMKKFIVSILTLSCAMNMAVAQNSAEEREALKQEIKNTWQAPMADSI